MALDAKNIEEKILMRAERNPVEIPEAITVVNEGSKYTFSSVKGSLTYDVHSDVLCEFKDKVMTFSLLNPKSRSQVGTAKARIINILEGITKGYEKKLLLVGVGYKAKLEGSNKLMLSLGKSHPDIYNIPEDVKISLPNQTEIILTSIDKVKLGQVAADIRSLRSPEPYKGKGIRYADEVISLKEVKKQWVKEHELKKEKLLRDWALIGFWYEKVASIYMVALLIQQAKWSLQYQVLHLSLEKN